MGFLLLFCTLFFSQEANAILEKAKVLEATIFSAKEVTSSILAAIEREDADLKSGGDIGVKVQGLVKNVERKMTDIRKRKPPSGLDVHFEPGELSGTLSLGHLSDLLSFVGVLWLNNKELLLVADRRQERDCITLRVVKFDNITDVLWEEEISPSDKEAPITSAKNSFQTGTILLAVGLEVFVLGVDHTKTPTSAVCESLMSLDIQKGTHVTALSVRHDGNILIATNLSNMIMVFTEDGKSEGVIDVLAEDDVMYPISLCSISYYRTAACCCNANKVIVLSHSWNGAKTKRSGYLTHARESPDGRLVHYVCKSVKSSLSGWLVLWFTSEMTHNNNNNCDNNGEGSPEDAVIWEVVCYDYVTTDVTSIAEGNSRIQGIPVAMDVRENHLAVCFPDGKLHFHEV